MLVCQWHSPTADLQCLLRSKLKMANRRRWWILLENVISTAQYTRMKIGPLTTNLPYIMDYNAFAPPTAEPAGIMFSGCRSVPVLVNTITGTQWENFLKQMSSWSQGWTDCVLGSQVKVHGYYDIIFVPILWMQYLRNLWGISQTLAKMSTWLKR